MVFHLLQYLKKKIFPSEKKKKIFSLEKKKDNSVQIYIYIYIYILPKGIYSYSIIIDLS